MSMVHQHMPGMMHTTPPVETYPNHTTIGGHGNMSMPGHGTMSMPGHRNMSMPGHGNMSMPGHGNMSMPGHGHPANSNGTHTGMGHNNAHTGHNAQHNTFFNVEYPVQILLVEWLVATPGQLAGACIGVFIISILYEGLKVLRTNLLAKSIPKPRHTENGRDASNGKRTEFVITSHPTSSISRMCSGWHILQSVLQVVQTTLGMFLMLIYMTFNVWLALCVSLGSGFGYYFFGWMQNHNQLCFGDHCN